jgi:hypothetical protein
MFSLLLFAEKERTGRARRMRRNAELALPIPQRR